MLMGLKYHTYVYVSVGGAELRVWRRMWCACALTLIIASILQDIRLCQPQMLSHNTPSRHAYGCCTIISPLISNYAFSISNSFSGNGYLVLLFELKQIKNEKQCFLYTRTLFR